MSTKFKGTNVVCPCGRPAIKMRDSVPCCARCDKLEDATLWQHNNGQKQSTNGARKYIHYYGSCLSAIKTTVHNVE